MTYDLVSTLREIALSEGSREFRAAQIADAIRRHGFRWVGIYDVTASEIAVIGWSGPAAPAYPRFPVERGLSGAAVKSGQIVVANDVSTDPRYLSTLNNTGAEMIVPVKNGARVVGTIDVESEAVGRFSGTDRELIERCAEAIRPVWD